MTHVAPGFKRKPSIGRRCLSRQAICDRRRGVSILSNRSAIFPRSGKAKARATKTREQRPADNRRTAESHGKALSYPVSESTPRCFAGQRYKTDRMRRRHSARKIHYRERARVGGRIVPSRGNSICGTLRRNPAPANSTVCPLCYTLHPSRARARARTIVKYAPLSCPR